MENVKGGGLAEEEAILVNAPTEVYRYSDPNEFGLHPHDDNVFYD
jgi:dTDP-4-dehydrorhamnose 3,5-epimerase